MSTFAVVPVKSLLKSKTRLSNFFTFQERTLFTLAMLQDVLNALESSNVNNTVIVSSDLTVEGLVKDFGMTFLKETQRGLNQALSQATKWCVRNAAEWILVLPADVPLITSKDINLLTELAVNNSVVISPSRNGGTNALLQMPPQLISPCFGPDSFKKHVSEALAKHVRTKIYISSNVMSDIDSEKDLEQFLKAGRQTASYCFLKQSSWSKNLLSR
ncbi:MAG TPA: 2-phospho-L-lactate guanylyltransferase [Candidatus Limnocylindrales bacterium]|nr:2-phospho-L-lactate guanylyltransferase [Candidatus Limnocylindrales bacterium]